MVNVANGFYTAGCRAGRHLRPPPTAFSGLDTCKVTVTGGTANGVGTFT